jgi:hypothetical protein
MIDMLGAIVAAAVIPVIALIGFLLFVSAEGEPGMSRVQRVRAMWHRLWQQDAPTAVRDLPGYSRAEAPIPGGDRGQRP